MDTDIDIGIVSFSLLQPLIFTLVVIGSDIVVLVLQRFGPLGLPASNSLGLLEQGCGLLDLRSTMLPTASPRSLL